MKRTLLFGARATCLICCILAAVPSASAQAKRVSRLSNDLVELQQPARMARIGASALPLVKENGLLLQNDMVAIDIIAQTDDASALLPSLQALGLTQGSAHRKVVSGFFPIKSLARLEQLAGVHYVFPAYVPVRMSSGSVVSQGDASLRAPQARRRYRVTGEGTKVGILSDSYDALGGAAAGVASGDLPRRVQVLLDGSGPGFVDEGRAMAEIIHDVAPGAKLAFHTAFTGQAGFANGIRALADAGCDIIVDDVAYLDEPYFQDGIIAQAIDEVTKRKITYFSAAGNHADVSYEAPFKRSGLLIPDFGEPHSFAADDWQQSVTIAPGQAIRIGLQWDDPFFSVSGGEGTTTDLDLLVLFENSIIVPLSAISDNLASKDPVEILQLRNNGADTITIELAIVKYAGPDPRNIKWVNFGNSSFPPFVEYVTGRGASTLVGHANAESCIAVGAAAWFNTPAFDKQLSTAIVNNFSSKGGTPIYLKPDGSRTGGRFGRVRQKPELVAPDGGNTTFFVADIPQDDDQFPNFFGTSAAAPHAAAVAALMQEEECNRLSPKAILNIMQRSALDMDDPATRRFDRGFDFRTGAGFLQADESLERVAERDGGRHEARRIMQPFSLSAWPNPTSGVVNLLGNSGTSSTGAVLTITNFAGQQVWQATMPQGTWQKQLNLQKLGAGMYMLQLNNGQEVVTQKLIIQ